jgi:general secretion pathway protein I
MCRAPAHPQSQQGFTLLEVLLAFLVFALSFAVTLEILTGAIRNTARAKEQTEASLIAQSLMDQVGFDIPLSSGASFEGDEGNYRWQIEIFPYEGSADNARSIELMDIVGLDLLEVECVVSWGEGERVRTQVFSTVKAIRPDVGGVGT